MTQDRRITDRHPDRPLDWSDTETLAGQEWKVLATPHAVAGKGEVPEGWKLAPDEPTDAMTYIGQKMRYDPTNSIGSIYCAMLSASPAAPAIPQQPELRKATTELSLPELARELATVAEMGWDYALSPGACGMLARALGAIPSPGAAEDEQLRQTEGYRLGWMEGMQEGAELATGGEKTAADVEAEFASLLPGSYYMDPPDGGSPSVLEQVRRMAEDAALYRASLSSPAERQEAEADRGCASEESRELIGSFLDAIGFTSPASAAPVLQEQAATMLAQRKKIQALEKEVADLRARLAAPSTTGESGTVDTPEKPSINWLVLLANAQAWARARAKWNIEEENRQWKILTDCIKSDLAQIDQHTAEVVKAETGWRDETIVDLSTKLVAAEHAAKWVSVDERLPDGECLAVYVTPNGKQRTIRAKYARQFQIEAEGDDCETEYNEDDDTFYIKAGWLECIDNWGEYSSCYVVEGTVTHWMPLPRTPQSDVQGEKE